MIAVSSKRSCTHAHLQGCIISVVIAGGEASRLRHAHAHMYSQVFTRRQHACRHTLEHASRLRFLRQTGVLPSFVLWTHPDVVHTSKLLSETWAASAAVHSFDERICVRVRSCDERICVSCWHCRLVITVVDLLSWLVRASHVLACSGCWSAVLADVRAACAYDGRHVRPSFYVLFQTVPSRPTPVQLQAHAINHDDTAMHGSHVCV
jgi:hypothetical protein